MRTRASDHPGKAASRCTGRAACRQHLPLCCHGRLMRPARAKSAGYWQPCHPCAVTPPCMRRPRPRRPSARVAPRSRRPVSYTHLRAHETLMNL
eukprot:4053256-Prymnesium_polylepis.1